MDLEYESVSRSTEEVMGVEDMNREYFRFGFYESY